MDILLVNKKDEIIGKGEKLAVHKKGLQHRCFSIFIFDKQGRLLLQKRAITKYHSGGLWSNTCCSHPCFDKNIKQQAKKRLQEEMGFRCSLQERFVFNYKAKVGDLIENEVDHVFYGVYNGIVKPNNKEADGYQYLTILELKKQIKQNPKQFTYWLKKVINTQSLCLKLTKQKK